MLAITFSTQGLVFAEEYQEYYLGGFPLGFDLSANGALVVGLSEVICEDDVYLPAKDAGINQGDYILSLNGKRIFCASDIDEVLRSNKTDYVIAEILSNGELFIKKIYPKKDLSGTYKIGVLIRDYLSGIGTVTLIAKNGCFASLGHPIIDESGNTLGVGGGSVYKCNIIGVIKSERGKAGELNGNILRNLKVGKVIKNTNVGLIGKFENIKECSVSTEYTVGEPSPGVAEVYTTISGESPKKYSISIVKVDMQEKTNKNMIIKITDERLIKYSGGIVQGMSGSPIVQNGKIVGAVTHVFLNDSTRGYAISIDKMIAELN